MNDSFDDDGGPYFAEATVVALLHLTLEQLWNLVAKGRIIAVHLEDGTPIYPTSQFDKNGSLLPHLEEVWPILIDGFGEWDAADWLTLHAPELDDRTFVEILRNGSADEIEFVMDEARHDADQMKQ